MERKHEKYQQLIARCQTLTPVPTAVAHPCDESSLKGAVEAAELGILQPILVGPKAKIEAVAAQFQIDLSGYEIVDTPHSRTERRISHAFIMDVPSLDRVLVITDAAINIFPTLEDKVHITQNAIDLVRALGLDQPKVAILSAMETVNPNKVPSTVEAAALCKMADRQQITGGILDGPLALDNAINLAAAKIKKIDSPVAGLADILVVPDLEAGNMLAKSLTFLADADAAGIVLGARVPIILTSRADSVTTRLASCAVAALVAQARRATTTRAVM